MVAETAVRRGRGAGCLSRAPMPPAHRLLQPPPCPGLWGGGTLGHRVTGQALRQVGGNRGLGRPWAVLCLGGHRLLFLLQRKFPWGLPSRGGTWGCWGTPRPEGHLLPSARQSDAPPPLCFGLLSGLPGRQREWRSQVCVLSVLMGKMGSQGYIPPPGLLGGLDQPPKQGLRHTAVTWLGSETALLMPLPRSHLGQVCHLLRGGWGPRPGHPSTASVPLICGRG